ncbi:DUF697 domain-containing protein [Reyranella sp.]|jgi:uncharacterized membrane protein YcjF (UPF0283 family)|uniref:YcjF family protein n=2 Tax=Reyranella sp. TaxID=1929291 RepID=UPI000BCAA26B|nr:DUF697 domain-containing protein [Reyranella sp.]OYY36267.1 MAG: hypothetical protein B7Y57_25080 [Rhodospirillales bacterium 35-66-84]OYZ91178.1 MAG: hypothetical protein B7Y08_27375 [Rhodospirillales bacterium 24-66-33]OZB22674.1 MAG: hypothetical protein B7X63_22420 [Rhodospirillales bacterium 39-66-50]
MSMTPQAETPRRLVDMEFRPGDLPPADAPSLDEALPEVTTRPPAIRWPAKLALGSAGLLLLLFVVDGAVSLLRSAIEQGSLLDLAQFAVLVALVGSTLWLLAGQARAYARLKSAERARELAEHLARLGGVGSGGRLVGVLDALYAGNPEVRGKLGAVSAALQPQHTDADVIDLLNREIFVPMDRRADDRIQRAALRASLGVAACPHPALDALVVLGISVALVKDLMQIYGLRHSARAVWRIISHVLFSASSTAVMSTVVEFAMKAAQDRLAAAVVGTAGEALVVARRTFALGMLAKEEIRPLPAPR